MRPQLSCKRKQLIDVAFPISDMHTTSWLAEQLSGLTHVLQPADTLFPLDGHARRIDLPFRRVGTMKLVARPELHDRQPKWQAIDSRDQAGVHKNAATGVEAGTSRPSRRAGSNLLRNPDRLRMLMLVRELRRVMQHQHRRITVSETFPCRPEVSSQTVRFADPLVREESIRSLRVRPILRSPRRGRSYSVRKVLQQLLSRFRWQTSSNSHPTIS